MEVIEEETKEKPQTPSLLHRAVDQWHRSKDHFNNYPYVWASYVFVFGGLGLYTAHRWRALRKAEDELLKFQERLKQTMTPEAAAEAMEEEMRSKNFGRQ